MQGVVRGPECPHRDRRRCRVLEGAQDSALQVVDVAHAFAGQEEEVVTSGRGCAEQAALTCGRTGRGRTQPALLLQETKYPLYQLLLSS